MALKLWTFQIGSTPQPEQGIRLGVVRYLPRGVKKEDYQRLGLFDLWFPVLAPSRELLQNRNAALFRRYRAEILKDSEKRQTLLFLAEVAKKTPVAIGCYCVDESKCHRSVLRAMIEEAGSDRLPAK
jgi:uncharacterized protein YeaO (DUF488 family)